MSNNYSTDLELSSSQYWSITNANQTGLSITSDITIEAWIKLEQLPSTAGSDFGIISKWDGTNGYTLKINSSDTLFFNGENANNRLQIFSDGAIVGSSDVGEWIHIAITVEASTMTGVIYKNKVSFGVTYGNKLTTSWGATTNDFYVGRDAYGTYLDGLINNLRVWNDIRTSTEISDNWKEVLSSDTGLVASWFNETQSGTDMTSNNNDLTNNNSAIFVTDVPFKNLHNVANVKIDHTKVDADLTDYPVYIDLADMPDSFWDIVSNGGGDIRVYKNDGTTQLAREVVSCDTTAKTGELHVKYTGTLSSTTDTTIQIWADGTSSEPTASSTYGSEAVWSDYKGVWHMNDLTTSTIADSSGNAYNGNKNSASNPPEVTGKMGKAQEFDGNTDYISFPATALDTSNSQFTFQLWMNLNGITGVGKDVPFFYGKNGGGESCIWTRFLDTNEIQFYAGENSNYAIMSTPDNYIETNTDMLIHWRRDSSNLALFRDGTNKETVATSAYNVTNSDAVSILGNWDIRAYSDRALNGSIDEFRLRLTALSDTWISTEYNNQNSPSTFYSVCDPSLVHTANIEIQSSKVDADLTDYPVYVDLSDLPDSFWNSVSEDGGDIRVYKEDDNTQLAREIVSIDTTAKTGEMHIKYSGVLSSTANTVIHVFTNGCSSEPASDSTYGSEAVWSNYQSVWHMNESSDSIYDSTSNNKTATPSGSLTYNQTGEIGKAIDFVGNDDFFDTNSNYLSNKVFFDVWVKVDSFSNQNLLVSTYHNYGNGPYGLSIRITNSTRITIQAGNGTGTIASIDIDPLSFTLNTNTFYKITGFIDTDNGKGKILVNGNLEVSDTSQPTLTIAHGNVTLGQADNYLSSSESNRALDGKMDEIRLGNTELSNTWISTEYNNQNSPSTFYSVSVPITSNNPIYSRTITIDNTKIDASLTDFPVLVKLTSSNFDFTKTKSDGSDIIFELVNGTLLKFEKERYDSVNQVAEYWVKIPTVSSSTDTTFIMKYGDTSAFDSSDPTNVWDSNYEMVQHMEDNTTSTILDSTSNNNNGTKGASNEPLQVNGQIAKAQSFNGSSYHIDCGNNINTYQQSFTIEANINLTGYSSSYVASITSNRKPSNHGCLFFVRGTADSPNEKKITFDTNESTGTRMIYGTTQLSLSTNYYVVVTFYYNGSNNNIAKIYVNGVLENTVSSMSNILDSTTNPFQIGADVLSDPNYFFNGIIDEVRKSNVVRSAAYIKATYNSLWDNLLTYGGEEVLTTNSSNFFQFF